MTIADISDEIDVQPSSVIRFSKAMGFNGFSDVQRILRRQLNQMMPGNYYARLDEQDSGKSQGELGRVVELAERSLSALPDPRDIAVAAGRLAAARMIHVVGMRRAFGIASYATYLLSGFGAPVHQITGVGAMADGALQLASPADVLLAISFPNYRAETLDVVKMANAASVPIIALTDSTVSPIAKLADMTLLADQSSDAGFRSTVGSVVVVQALAMEYGRVRGG